MCVLLSNCVNIYGALETVNFVDIGVLSKCLNKCCMYTVRPRSIWTMKFSSYLYTPPQWIWKKQSRCDPSADFQICFKSFWQNIAFIVSELQPFNTKWLLFVSLKMWIIDWWALSRPGLLVLFGSINEKLHIVVDVLLQVLSKVVGRATTPSCSGCWCRWSCGCFSCRVRSELRLSSTALCQMKLSNTVGATLSTADQLTCVLLQETLVWLKNYGRSVRGWWNWPDAEGTILYLVAILFMVVLFFFFLMLSIYNFVVCPTHLCLLMNAVSVFGFSFFPHK